MEIGGRLQRGIYPFLIPEENLGDLVPPSQRDANMTHFNDVMCDNLLDNVIEGARIPSSGGIAAGSKPMPIG